MTRDELKKVIQTAIATGSIVAAGAYGANKLNCDYTIDFKDEKICVSEQQKQLIESQLPISKGFGGIKFGGEK